MVEQTDWNKTRLRYRTMEDLAPGRSPELDRIIDIFLSEKPIHPHPEEVSANRSPDIEAQMTARILGLDDPLRAAR